MPCHFVWEQLFWKYEISWWNSIVHPKLFHIITEACSKYSSIAFSSDPHSIKNCGQHICLLVRIYDHQKYNFGHFGPLILVGIYGGMWLHVRHFSKQAVSSLFTGACSSTKSLLARIRPTWFIVKLSHAAELSCILNWCEFLKYWRGRHT